MILTLEERVAELEKLVGMMRHAIDVAVCPQNARDGRNDPLEPWPLDDTPFSPADIAIDQEEDGRFIAEMTTVPGIMAYGATEAEARANVAQLLSVERDIRLRLKAE